MLLYRRSRKLSWITIILYDICCQQTLYMAPSENTRPGTRIYVNHDRAKFEQPISTRRAARANEILFPAKKRHISLSVDPDVGQRLDSQKYDTLL